MNDIQFDQLMKKLDVLSKLIAINVVTNKSLKDQVITLRSAGLPISEISKILDKKMTDIGQYVYRKKKSKKNKSKNTNPEA